MFVAAVFLLIAVVVKGSHQNALDNDGDVPVWETYSTCTIPNESNPGVCMQAKSCAAFGKINQGPELSSVGRLSFIRALQCQSGNETNVCCPQNGLYSAPELNSDIRRRIRNESFDVGNRFGGSECGIQAFDYKIQGLIAEIDEFPWAALLFYRNNFHGCGGVLISSTFVLTAAHCLTGPGYDKFGPLNFVRLREYNLHSDPDCMVINNGADTELDCTEKKIDASARSIRIHPDYNANSDHQQHDIGLIQIDRTVPYSDFLRPICLPGPGMQIGLQEGRLLSVCGWGKTDFFNSALVSKSPVKMKAQLPYVEPRRCTEAYRSQRLSLGPGQICAGGRKDRDSCAGDSGSPLMFFDRKSAVWVLTGVVSRGPATCGSEDRPGIYTKVSEYLPWIKQNTGL